MDFATLLKPYADIDKSTNRPLRTIEGQIKWLARKNIPRNVIDQAILKVYNELQDGLKFEDTKESTGGHKLDQYLLKIAQEIYQSTLEKQAKELESFLSNFRESAVKEYVKVHQNSIWKRIKAVFKP